MLLYRFLFINIAFLAIAFITSCSQKSTDKQVILISPDTIEKDSLPFIVDGIVPLKTTSDNLLSTQLLIRKYHEGYLVKDERQRGKDLSQFGIHHFDREGNYLGKIISVGEGPNELPNIKDYIVDNDQVEVLVSNGQESSIEIFSFSGSKKTTKKFNFLVDTFIKKTNGNYLFYGGYNAPIVQERLIETDPKGNILASYLHNDYTGKLIPVQERNFSLYEGKISFKEAFNPKVYSVSDTLNPTFEMNSSPFSIPSEFWELDFMEGFQLINEKGFAFIEDYFEGKDWVLFHISVQEQGKMNHELVLYNKSTGALKRNELTEASLWHKPIGFDENSGQFMFLVHPQVLMKAKTLRIHSNDLSDIEVDDNPVIVFASIGE
ncbi:6-bladed beta-propeller [Echinicola marina]|uniref:6-bladed beta-propeller n=1 Tax=Echinicola marina TaxID=2859768 RepID=UPI001CF707A0|nr:6-bladed beta-propeller [Echinicola marina]UCS94917.1 6-bladed beta-propeller [Echinicola marina]